MRKIAAVFSATAALVFAPPCAADVAGLGPFVGEWDGKRERVTIDGTGHSSYFYADVNACANCAMADVPYNTMHFVLTSVANGVASGTVTSSSGSRSVQVGRRVTVRLQPQPPGPAIEWSIGGLDEGLYCTSAIASYCGG